MFDDQDLNRSLFATADFCNQGCTAIFTSTSATIIHDQTGKIICQDSKDPHARLWPHDITAVAPIPSSNNVVRHEINADFVSYSHGSFCSPVDTSMANALQKGWLGNFPRLTATMFNANKPNSLSTAKGHLSQTKQKSKAAKKAASSPPPPDYEEIPDEPQFFDYIFTKLRKSNELLNSSDMPGRFTHVSYRGYEYMLISIFRGYIHAEPLKSRQAADLTAAYRSTYNFFSELGHRPQFQVLDNEDSGLLQKFLKNEVNVSIEYVPPNTHRRNRAERAIRDWKGHLISCLDNVDKDFRMSLWCELLPQIELTLAHLRPYLPDPTISSYEGIFGKKFDFIAHPIHPPGVKVIILDPVTTRESWAPHGLTGFYLGPAIQHFKSFRIFVPSTNGIRVSDSVSWHPEKLKLPGSSKEELIFLKAEEILSKIQNPQDPNFSTLVADLNLLLQVFSPTNPTSEKQRVVPTRAQLGGSEVPTVPILPVTIPSAPLNDSHPTDSRARAKRKAIKGRKIAEDAYIPLSRASCPKSFHHVFKYVGKHFTDQQDKQAVLHFQVTKIVTPKNFKKPNVPFFMYFDTDKFNSAPLLQEEYEFTPCAEFLKRRKFTGALYSPQFILWDSEAAASEKTPPAPAEYIFHTAGEAHITRVLSQFADMPNPNFIDPAPKSQRSSRYQFKIAQAYSTFHSSSSSPLLNLTPEGKQLTYRGVMRGDEQELWGAASGEELIKLIVDRKTLVLIHRHEQPADQRKFTTYYNPQVKEKLDADGAKTQRVRGTFGGNRKCA